MNIGRAACNYHQLKSITTINNSVISIISHSKKSLLFNKTFACVKKGDNSLFDVKMKSCDRAKICKLFGLFLSNRLSTDIGKSGVGLYRVYGLTTINNLNTPNLDRIRKDVIVLFKEEVLSITIELKVIKTDF